MTYDSLKRDVPEIEKIIGYTFRDKSLLMQAFTRSSWCNENGGGYQSNEVLEFFGDSVLSAVIVSFLLSMRTERYRFGIKTELGEGDFSNIKSKLSDKTNLSRSTKKLGLEKYLLMGEGDIKLGIREEPSVMEDLFESIVGAVYIDTGKDIPTVTEVVSNILDMTVYADSSAPQVSPKNALQEWCADKKRRLPAPVYKTLEERGPDHKKIYVRGVYIGDRLVATAEGKNQKTADSKAAEEALRMLRTEDAAQAAPKPEPKLQAEPTSTAPKAEKESPKPEQNAPKEPSVPASKAKKDATNPQKENPEAPKRDSKPEKKAIKPTKEPDIPKIKAEKVAPKHENPTEKPGAKTETASQSSHAEPKDPKKAISEAKPPKNAVVSALTLLKKHAQSLSAPSPAFRDLGTFGSGADIEYHIECSYMGRRVIASGSSRLDAREHAAALIAKELKIKHN